MAIRSDASGDYGIRTTDLINYNAAYTYMAWVRLVVDRNDYTGFFSLDAASAESFDFIGCDSDGTTTFLEVSDAGAFDAINGPANTVGVWTHFAMVRTDNSTLVGYRNGSSFGSINRNVSGRAAVGKMVLLRLDYYGSSVWLNGRIDAVKAWTAALSADEIRSEMYTRWPRRWKDLYEFWPCFPGTNRLNGRSGKGRNFSANGTLTDEAPKEILWGSTRAARIFLPAAAGGQSGSISESAAAAATLTAIATAPASTSQAATAASIYTAIATVAASIAEAATASDSHGGPAIAPGTLTAAASGNEIVDAVAQAAASLIEGASAGETWTAQAQALATLIANGAAAESIDGAAAGTFEGAISESTSAAASFIAAVQAVASLTNAASAQAALTATVGAIASISESAAAAAAFSGAATRDADTSESATATATFSAIATLRATLLETLGAGAVWTAAGVAAVTLTAAASAQATFIGESGEADYLIVGAISIRAALSASVRVVPALSADVSVEPALQVDSVEIKQ